MDEGADDVRPVGVPVEGHPADAPPSNTMPRFIAVTEHRVQNPCSDMIPPPSSWLLSSEYKIC